MEFDAFATTRNGDALQPLACGETGYGIAYGGEESVANQLPILVVFRKSEYGMCYFYGTQLFFAPPEDSQHPRHMDPTWTLWNFLGDALGASAGMAAVT